jgi:hypothetical protein
VALYVDHRDIDRVRGQTASAVYGVVKEAGYYAATLTRFDVLRAYYTEQLGLLVERCVIELSTCADLLHSLWGL